MNYWAFSNYPAGSYDGNIWDTKAIFRTRKWFFGENNPNALNVRRGDIAVARIYGESYFARIRCVDSWKYSKKDSWRGTKVGFIPFSVLDTFNPPLPQHLVIDEISNKNVRNKIIRLTAEDHSRIDLARKVFAKMGGTADATRKVVLLEKGLEEALKHNLGSLGLSPAPKKLAQQFRMAVGRSDLICNDKKGDFWVLELKRSQQPALEVVGQVNKYRGWLQENI